MILIRAFGVLVLIALSNNPHLMTARLRLAVRRAHRLSGPRGALGLALDGDAVAHVRCRKRLVQRQLDLHGSPLQTLLPS